MSVSDSDGKPIGARQIGQTSREKPPSFGSDAQIKVELTKLHISQDAGWAVSNPFEMVLVWLRIHRERPDMLNMKNGLTGKKLILCTAFTLTLAACGGEEPVESASETMEDISAEVDQMIDSVDGEGPFEEAGESMDEAAQAIKDEADDAAEKAKEAMEN